MNKSYILVAGLMLLSFNMIDWKPGKTDSNGDLIIVEMENHERLKADRPQHETITVDMTWSILIKFMEERKPEYHIFNNETKKIFSTGSFTEFLKELEKIPDNTTIRKINKCTLPFDYIMPEAETKQIKNLIMKKNCILEDKVMFCNCVVKKSTYGYE